VGIDLHPVTRTERERGAILEFELGVARDQEDELVLVLVVPESGWRGVAVRMMRSSLRPRRETSASMTSASPVGGSDVRTLPCSMLERLTS
jgi:hypothetical protein